MVREQPWNEQIVLKAHVTLTLSVVIWSGALETAIVVDGQESSRRLSVGRMVRTGVKPVLLSFPMPLMSSLLSKLCPHRVAFSAAAHIAVIGLDIVLT